MSWMQSPAIHCSQADVGCVKLERQNFYAKALQKTLHSHNYLTLRLFCTWPWKKGHSIEQITKQQSANTSQVKCSHGYRHEYIELMKSLTLEPIVHCPQLKGKYASSNGNWTKELDNSALRKEHLVKVESKARTSLVRESFSTRCYLQVTRALRIDLVKHRWYTWSRDSGGSHHDGMAGLTSLQQNKAVLQASMTTNHTFSTQDLAAE